MDNENHVRPVFILVEGILTDKILFWDNNNLNETDSKKYLYKKLKRGKNFKN